MGIELRARRNAADTRDGLEVVRVAPDGTAARAGVCPGDWLVSVNAQIVVEARELAAYVRTLEAGAPVTFVVERQGERFDFCGENVPLPVERIAHADVHLEQIVVGDHRRRLLFTTPNAANRPYTTILYMQGLGTQSCELSSDADEPLRRLLEGFSEAGFATLRVERSGMGDSEGPAFSTTDLFDDVSAYEAALGFLAQHSDVGEVILFGHSVGGMIAPLLAGEGTPVHGIVVFGTSALRWVDCIVRATRRQKGLGGMTGDELEAYVDAWSAMHEAVCRGGLSPWQVFERAPGLRWLEGTACRGETMFGRNARFFQQIERLDLVALWKTVPTNVLVMHGEFDWACGVDEGRAIADAMAEVDASRVRFAVLDAVGHDMRRHASLAESYANPRGGHWDERMVSIPLDWLREISR